MLAVFFPISIRISVQLPVEGRLCLPVETCTAEVIASEFLSCLREKKFHKGQNDEGNYAVTFCN